MSGPITGEWKNLVDGTYKGFKFHVAVPAKGTGQGVMREQLDLKARNQVIRRPGVNGGEIVRMGLDPEDYTCDVIFFGDNWSSLFDQFKAVLVDPNPGKLVLPTHSKAVNACFARMTALAQVGDGNAKTTTVTWIQDEATDQSTGVVGAGVNAPAGSSLGALATVAATATSALSSAQGAVQSAVNGANAVIQASGVLQAVNAFESGLSTVRRFSNMVLTMTTGIRARITQIQANLTSTMALAEQAITAITGASAPTSASIANAAIQASTATATTAVQSTPSIDAETGQLIIPNTQNASVTPAPNPLAPPPLAPNTGIMIGDLTSDTAQNALAAQIIAVLQDQSAELNGYVNGAASDIEDAMTPLITAIQDFFALSTASSSIQILTTAELSLGEVMFYNGIPLSQLLTVHQQNPQILDPAVVPAGTVVNL